MSLETKAKILQKVFEDKDFIYKLVQNSEDLNEDLTSVFSYYLCTEDENRNYTTQEIISKLTELKRSGNNIIDEIYCFQAYNGGCDKSYKKNGLDDISSIPKNVTEAVTFLENELGKTYCLLGGYDGEYHKSFITGNPSIVMRYALNYAPERLWAGILCETGNYRKPLKTSIKIGESKSQYMMRIIENRIEQLNISPEKKKEILKKGEIVSEFYGSKRPRIAIIPGNMIKDKRASGGKFSGKTYGEYAEKEQYSWKENLQTTGNLESEAGLIIYDKILPNQFRTISIPDQFELMQIKAIQRGAEIGDLINPYTGILEERKRNGELAVVRPKNPILGFIQKFYRNKSVENNIDKNNGRANLNETLETSVHDKRKNIQELSKILSNLTHTIYRTNDRQNEKSVDMEK